MFSEMFGTFKIKNNELGSLADYAYECCVGTAKEQSAGMTMGLDEHAIRRQRAWLENAEARLTGLAERPLPDLPATHPILFEHTYEEPEMIAVDGQVLNSDAKAVARAWHTVCYELIKSNSAGLGGGMTAFDADRCTNNLAAISQFLDAIEAAADVDFPETAAPEATTSGKIKRK